MDVALQARTVFLERVRRIVAESGTAEEAAREILAAIDEGYDPDAAEDAPGWALVEVDLETGEETGRDLAGLLESF
jgi:hypothetical protein